MNDLHTLALRGMRWGIVQIKSKAGVLLSTHPLGEGEEQRSLTSFPDRQPPKRHKKPPQPTLHVKWPRLPNGDARRKRPMMNSPSISARKPKRSGPPRKRRLAVVMSKTDVRPSR